jgi:hypothetical protein
MCMHPRPGTSSTYMMITRGCMHAPVSIKKVMSMQYVCMHPLAIIIKNICQPLFLWSPHAYLHLPSIVHQHLAEKNLQSLRSSDPLVITRPGHLRFMSPYCLLLCCFFCLYSFGNSETPLKYWNWIGHCVACGKTLKGMPGVFCANFASYRHPWKACQQAWCGSCYTPHPLDKFYQFQPMNETGIDWHPQEDLICAGFITYTEGIQRHPTLLISLLCVVSGRQT